MDWVVETHLMQRAQNDNSINKQRKLRIRYGTGHKHGAEKKTRDSHPRFYRFHWYTDS